jgi:hypothetical protein
LNDGAALADALRADLAADLATYDIRDTSTLRSYYRALSTIAMLQHHPDDAVAYEEKARALEEKPAARLYQVLCSGRRWRRKGGCRRRGGGVLGGLRRGVATTALRFGAGMTCTAYNRPNS